MATIATSTRANRETLKGALLNAAKQMDILMSREHMLDTAGPEVDAYLQAAADALIATGYAEAVSS